MHKSISNLESKKLLEVFASSWWQLDASYRHLIAQRGEPIHHILAKLYNRDVKVRVVRGEEAADTPADADDENRDR